MQVLTASEEEIKVQTSTNLTVVIEEQQKKKSCPT